MSDIENKLAELEKRVDGIDLTSKAQAWMALAAAGQRGNYAAFNAGGKFSPGEPLLPTNSELEPRVFQYRVGTNLVYIPRAGYGLLDFQMLRNLASASKEIRLNIEKVKQTIAGLEWEIIADNKTAEVRGVEYSATPDVDAVRRFWERPDGQHDFDTWIRMLLEEILVTDALTLYPNKSANGFRLEIIDGTTIRPLTDFHGRVPDPPDPAYLQVLYGAPMSWFAADRLLYLPRNARVNSPYGESPIEWIVQSIIQSIKHDLARVNYYTDGNVPAAFVGLPSSWSVSQIKEFDEWYNAIIQGDIARANRLMFLPHDGTGTPVTQFNNSDMDNVQLDEWLMTVACWAFGNSPSEFGLTRGDGLGGAGYMAAGENSQYRGMIATVTQYIKRIIDSVNRDHLDAPFAKFKWVGLEPPEDEVRQAQVDAQYIGVVYTPDYVADRLGIPEKYRVQHATSTPAPQYTTNVSAVPLPAQFEPYLRRAVEADLSAWKDKALRYHKKGWKQEMFISDVLPDNVRANIYHKIASAQSGDEIAQVFEVAMKAVKTDLQKFGIPFRDDPNQPIKDAVVKEADETLREYFSQLQQRIITAAIERKGK
jgi:hypothetical protein